MKRYYEIMSDILQIQYKIKSIICVLEALEGFYSEDTQLEIKSLTTVTKGYLEAVEGDTRQVIAYIDNLTAESGRNK